MKSILAFGDSLNIPKTVIPAKAGIQLSERLSDDDSFI